jgi:hypothetical protein
MLDQRLTRISARWPSLIHTIIRRATERSQVLALSGAINSLQHVELRLLVLLWHLADRFGRVTRAGTVVPLELSHRDLAELVGAQRPSVSTRLSELHRRGELVRQADRTWLLPGAPPVELRDTRARALTAPQIGGFEPAESPAMGVGNQVGAAEAPMELPPERPRVPVPSEAVVA